MRGLIIHCRKVRIPKKWHFWKYMTKPNSGCIFVFKYVVKTMFDLISTEQELNIPLGKIRPHTSHSVKHLV